MSNAFQAQFAGFGEFRNRGVEFLRESRARENAVEFRNRSSRGLERTTYLLQLVREFAQDAQNFCRFIFAELYELIVGFDGLERLHENGLSRRACAVDDSRNISTMFGAHGNDESVIPEGDVVLSCFR